MKLRYNAIVDATTNEVVQLIDWVSDASYNVFPLGINDPHSGDRVIVEDPAHLPASPLGWHAQSDTIQSAFTIGNNVYAQENLGKSFQLICISSDLWNRIAVILVQQMAVVTTSTITDQTVVMTCILTTHSISPNNPSNTWMLPSQTCSTGTTLSTTFSVSSNYSGIFKCFHSFLTISFQIIVRCLWI